MLQSGTFTHIKRAAMLQSGTFTHIKRVALPQYGTLFVKQDYIVTNKKYLKQVLHLKITYLHYLL